VGKNGGNFFQNLTVIGAVLFFKRDIFYFFSPLLFAWKSGGAYTVTEQSQFTVSTGQQDDIDCLFQRYRIFSSI